MSDNDFSVTIAVDKTPDEVFTVINDVRAWWSEEIVGDSGTVGDSYVFEVPGIHRVTMTTTESVPGERLVWRASDTWLSFVENTAEWDGTDVIFDLTPTNSGTELRFTHRGLVPSGECYEVCSNGWTGYVTTSLKGLLTTGIGDPYRASTPVAEEAAKHGNAELLGL
ncbi:SRPBCC family protein [Nocardia camponoti]|uniref:Activator of Hsp90 ATPase homologue 1/2-like C-terminal domain-containing protein n=1 Tax=Nocardia camponoti TaxID=1616106 RepID=A0A917V921_9NOCA|nr:SRPBCC domain-containing protein [Nocardia camponoti]GGK51814.1 hypothetical protein GCM10011591_24400 [Nocardia camponoti]